MEHALCYLELDPWRLFLGTWIWSSENLENHWRCLILWEWQSYQQTVSCKRNIQACKNLWKTYESLVVIVKMEYMYLNCKSVSLHWNQSKFDSHIRRHCSVLIHYSNFALAKCFINENLRVGKMKSLYVWILLDKPHSLTHIGNKLGISPSVIYGNKIQK